MQCLNLNQIQMLVQNTNEQKNVWKEKPTNNHILMNIRINLNTEKPNMESQTRCLSDYGSNL